MSLSIFLTASAIIFVLLRLAALTLRREGKIRVIDIMLGYLIFLQYLLVEFDIGPMSARVYLLLGMTTLVFIAPAKFRFRTSTRATNFLRIGIFYAIWYIGAAYLRNELSLSNAYALCSVYIFALLLFIVTVQYIDSFARLVFITNTIILLLTFNCVVGIAQWYGYGWAWELFAQIRPGSMESRQENIWLGKGEFGYTPALFEYSIPFSFFLLFSLLIWARFLYCLNGGTKRQVFVWAGLFFLSEGGLLVALSRSSIAFVNLLSFASAFLTRNSRSNRSAARIFRNFLVLLVFLVPTLYVTLSGSENEQGFNTSRLANFTETGREDLWGPALDLIFANPVIGPGAYSFQDAVGYEASPHNVFLVAGVYNGLLGIFLVSILMLLAIKQAYQGYRLSQIVGRHSPYLLGYSLVVLAYVMKGCFHNDSFATGGIFGWLSMALLSATIILSQNEA